MEPRLRAPGRGTGADVLAETHDHHV